ncbi:pyruvate formate-lyase-activating protein [Paenibacillus sp. MMS18-CY102]|uniref:pyruvate formate-lyase-activating protein n=1 Tax=Paenibacillus sp. MMS18-CY102 TaxID=2682849 RepID=UPI0013661B70|nr:pyruvate formate-lyase-activating protein [Paenibacillus sp. MMS18-CY102]MWC29903.1 pyruvate formate lyase-activating protein [Paenibacillus sp. MMS18-CY102]
MKGRIHSMETFGTVDGPGIRFVLFMQGCALQCQFCHNPDTWDPTAGRQVTVEEILNEIEPYLAYYKGSGGGITVTGGEPTLQAPFVAQLFKACKERYGLHTALDSSGFCEPSHAAELMSYTDLVLLDLKQMNKAKHEWLTSQPNDRILAFARWLSDIHKPAWIRHVLIPGITDNAEDLAALGAFIGQLANIEKIELLPYHRMGVYKWQQLGRAYPLEGVPTPSDREASRARALIDTAIIACREQTIGNQ